MKKLIALLLALLLVLCLAACGGEVVADDTAEDSTVTADISNAEITQEQLEALTEAYNEVAPLYNDVYAAAEANGWLDDAQTSAELDAVGGTLSFVGAGLTEDPTMLDGSDFDALPDAIRQLIPELEAMLERVSVAYEGAEEATGEEVVTDDIEAQIYALTEAYAQVAPLYNEVAVNAEANGWLEDEETFNTLDAIASSLSVIGTGLTEDMTLLEDADFAALTEEVLAMAPVLESLAEQVAAPYAG